MTETDTIEIDRAQLADYFHSRYQQAQKFYPPDEWAEEHADGDADGFLFNGRNGAYGYAKGNLIAEGDDLSVWKEWFGIDPRELAEEWADEHGHDTFEKPPFVEE